MDNKELAEAEERLEKYDGQDKIISSFDLKKILDKRKVAFAAIKSGFKILDFLSEGFLEGQIVTISGRSGHGKTTFSQSLTYNMALEGVQCLWFTYEVTPHQFLKKFHILPQFFLPASLTSHKTKWLEERIIEAKVKQDVVAIFIDHLYYLVPPSSKGNTAELIGETMRELKIMALKHSITIFLLTHVTKIKDEPLQLEDIKGSSFIVQESDFVMFVERKKDKTKSTKDIVIWTNDARISVQKNRHNGQLGYVQIYYDNVDKLFKGREE